MWHVAKYGIFCTNVIFTLAGISLVGVSIVASLKFSLMSYVLPPNFTTAPRIVTVLGLLIFFIAFFGCWIRENKYYLIAYVVSMFFLAASKIYLAVVIFQSMDDVEPLVATSLGSAFNDDELKQKFHDVEFAFQCCGTIGPESYLYPALPESCCLDPFDFGSYKICFKESAYEGCNKVLTHVCSSYGKAVGVVIIVTIMVEFAAMMFSLSVLCRGDKSLNV